jgi:hypothetical protein
VARLAQTPVRQGAPTKPIDFSAGPRAGFQQKLQTFAVRKPALKKNRPFGRFHETAEWSKSGPDLMTEDFREFL